MPDVKPAVTQTIAIYNTEPENAYSLYFRHGMNPQCVKGFKHKGDLRSAVERAKKHCIVMGYRYIFVRPLICDLDAEEQSVNENNQMKMNTDNHPMPGRPV